jgi:hypothetical protein
MNSVQMGKADLAPSKFNCRSSSNPTQTTHSNWEVKPANHPSCEVPVLPAAGTRNPRARTPAPVPLRRTSSSRSRPLAVPDPNRILARGHQGQHRGLHVIAAIGDMVYAPAITSSPRRR